MTADQLALGVFCRSYRTIRVAFPVAQVSTEVQHLCGEIPHGCLAVSVGGVVTRVPGVPWTKSLAYLQCDTIDLEAVVVFVVLREEPISVTP